MKIYYHPILGAQIQFRNYDKDKALSRARRREKKRQLN